MYSIFSLKIPINKLYCSETSNNGLHYLLNIVSGIIIPISVFCWEPFWLFSSCPPYSLLSDLLLLYFPFSMILISVRSPEPSFWSFLDFFLILMISSLDYSLSECAIRAYTSAFDIFKNVFWAWLRIWGRVLVFRAFCTFTQSRPYFSKAFINFSC